MTLFVEFAPLIAFFVLYKLYDIYLATAGLLIVSTLQLMLIRWRTGRIGKFRMAGYITLVLFAGLTLALHDPTFIKWKPTLFLGFLALVIIVSDVLGKPLIKHIFCALDTELMTVDTALWRKISQLWALSYGCQALANYGFAFYTPEATWVNFKVWGLTAASFMTVIATFWLLRMQQVQKEK